MRRWFRVEEPDADPAMVAGRPVRNLDPREGLFVDEEANSYRLAGGGQARPDYSEVIPVEGGPRLEAGAAPDCSDGRTSLEDSHIATIIASARNEESDSPLPSTLFLSRRFSIISSANSSLS
jgi:hypothetical protein